MTPEQERKLRDDLRDFGLGQALINKVVRSEKERENLPDTGPDLDYGPGTNGYIGIHDLD